MSWAEIYHDSFSNVLKNIKKVRGAIVGFNTNIDAIIDFHSEQILTLIKKIGVDPVGLYTNILKWKGKIHSPADFITGLCGCFEKGKASEWLIESEETYQYLLQNLPPPKKIQLGGQAGIIANLYAELGVKQIFVHTTTLPKLMRELFNKKKNIQIPLYNKEGELIFLHPRKVKDFDESLYFHIISEVHKGDTLKLGEKLHWKCPRDNRFIATFDPPNAELEILEAFQRDIEVLAEKSDLLILSGFHMLNVKKLGKEGVNQRIMKTLELITRAKKANPNLMVHLELASTKNKLLLERLYYYSSKDTYWNSLGCNERELVELLEAIKEKRLANEIKADMFINYELIIKGALKVCEKLKLERLHLHLFGCYLLFVSKDYPIPEVLLLKTLCFASLIAAHKAITGKAKGVFKFKEIIDTIDIDATLPKAFKKVNNLLKKIETYVSYKDFDLNEYMILAVPTIIVQDPIQTVGLGDTISAAALIAELTYRQLLF
ncbi:MAG: ADP-dependent glucokinase/phosphofructokinase [Candidatus Heimdallarchaeota archaeon]